eukprot:TRINITY_DN14691_c0_g1_i3.p1 TRINITY_DN14691_c0_g1~~TRINITY_DN14691_c0_g1_i3.p1  ORF type:complete len:126 (-),score=26.91 TRINITY_DN14691_c0_g1_i3:268-645(-)
MRDNSDDCDEDSFDFDVEFKEISQSGLIKSLEKVATEHKNSYMYKLVTLDDEELVLNCSISEGINVVKSSNPASVAVGNSYESLEQILTTISPKYNELFSQKLVDKLKELEKAQAAELNGDQDPN